MISNRPDKGFTLLEVMVALAIIATALVTLLGTHLLSLNLAHRHKEQTMATMLARQKMEELLTTPFESLTSDAGDFGSEHPGYKWETEVEDAEKDNLKRVKILIKLPESDFELDTFISRTVIE